MILRCFHHIVSETFTGEAQTAQPRQRWWAAHINPFPRGVNRKTEDSTMSKVEFDERRPKVDASVFLAPGSWIIGNATLKERVNVWTGTVIRGDDDTVVIGSRATVLENCIVEAPTGAPVSIGDDTIISHSAIVASGAPIPPRAVIPPNQLALGAPAKPVRRVRDAERAMVAREHERALAKA